MGSDCEVAIATSPGPDYAMYVKYTLVGVEEGSIGMAGMPGLAVSPNPGRGNFAFSVFLPIGCDVRLGVYDLSGRLVSVVSEAALVDGSYSFAWDSSVPAGVYAVCLDAGGKTVSRLMTVFE